MSDVKLCKDCYWCRNSVPPNPYTHPKAVCVHPSVAKPDLVDGGLRGPYAEAMRRDGSCGAGGVYWTARHPRPRWWQFWKERVSLCPGSIQCGNKCPEHNGGPE
jgi:hypothetical protein